MLVPPQRCVVRAGEEQLRLHWLTTLIRTVVDRSEAWRAVATTLALGRPPFPQTASILARSPWVHGSDATYCVHDGRPSYISMSMVSKRGRADRVGREDTSSEVGATHQWPAQIHAVQNPKQATHPTVVCVRHCMPPSALPRHDGTSGRMAVGASDKRRRQRSSKQSRHGRSKGKHRFSYGSCPSLLLPCLSQAVRSERAAVCTMGCGCHAWVPVVRFSTDTTAVPTPSFRSIPPPPRLFLIVTPPRRPPRRRPLPRETSTGRRPLRRPALHQTS